MEVNQTTRQWGVGKLSFREAWDFDPQRRTKTCCPRDVHQSHLREGRILLVDGVEMKLCPYRKNKNIGQAESSHDFKIKTHCVFTLLILHLVCDWQLVPWFWLLPYPVQLRAAGRNDTLHRLWGHPDAWATPRLSRHLWDGRNRLMPTLWTTVTIMNHPSQWPLCLSLK